MDRSCRLLFAPDRRQGVMAAHFTEDGVHPLDNGCAVMAPIAEPAIEKALGKRL